MTRSKIYAIDKQTMFYDCGFRTSGIKISFFIEYRNRHLSDRHLVNTRFR